MALTTLRGDVVARSIPPLPDVPEELHGEAVVMVAGTFIGPADRGTTVLAPFQELGDLVPEQVRTRRPWSR